MPFETMSVFVCDRCEAIENVPAPEFNGDEVVMQMAPDGWIVIATSGEPNKYYCRDCKFGIGGVSQ